MNHGEEKWGMIIKTADNFLSAFCVPCTALRALYALAQRILGVMPEVMLSVFCFQMRKHRQHEITA